MRPNIIFLNAEESIDGRPKRLMATGLHSNYSLNPCAYCQSDCCHLDVAVTIPEALKVAFTLNLSLQDLLRPLELNQNDVNCHFSPRIKTDKGDRYPHFQKSGEACMHLVRAGTRSARCSIYDVRPVTCLFYPFEFYWGKQHIQAGNTLLCPKKWMYTQETKARLGRYVRQWKKIARLDQELMADWNRGRAKPFEEFLHYAQNTLAAKLGYNPDALKAEAPPGARPSKPGDVRLW